MPCAICNRMNLLPEATTWSVLEFSRIKTTMQTTMLRVTCAHTVKSAHMVGLILPKPCHARVEARGPAWEEASVG